MSAIKVTLRFEPPYTEQSYYREQRKRAERLIFSWRSVDNTSFTNSDAMCQEKFWLASQTLTSDYCWLYYIVLSLDIRT